MTRVLDTRNRATVTAAVAALDVRPGETAGDLGFGGGLGLRLLLDRLGPGGRVHGVDLSATAVRRTWRRHPEDVRAGRLRLEEGSLDALPLPDGALDAALTTNTFYFVEDLPRVCRELARVLRPGGRLVVAVGDPQDMAAMAVTRHGFRLRPVEDVVTALDGAGLRLTAHRLAGRAGDVDHLLVCSRDRWPRSSPPAA